VTSAAALAAACGGVVDSTGLVGGGLYCTPENDPSCEGPNPDGGIGLIDSGTTNPCADGCGLVPSFNDGGDVDASEGDAGEGDGATGGGVIGVIVNLDAGDDDASTGVIGVLPHR
jgi:hypothetical protein